MVAITTPFNALSSRRLLKRRKGARLAKTLSDITFAAVELDTCTVLMKLEKVWPCPKMKYTTINPKKGIKRPIIRPTTG